MHPLELTITVKVTEDQALANVRLHYEVLRDAGGLTQKEAYVKSFIPKDGRRGHQCGGRLRPECEGIEPPSATAIRFSITCEAEDRKGQKAVWTCSW